MQRLAAVTVLLAISFGALASAPAGAVPPGFTNTEFASGLSQPTAFALAPDGRIFVTEKGGAVRVVLPDGTLVTQPFATLPVDDFFERGLLGIALHPQFESNGWVYVYRTVPGSPPHNRIERLTAAGNVAVGGPEPIVDLENLSAGNHNGGAIHFGPDGKLYAGVGENAVMSNAQTLSNRLGKILRYNDDGTIPADNPFGAGNPVYALGLRTRTPSRSVPAESVT